MPSANPNSSSQALADAGADENKSSVPLRGLGFSQSLPRFAQPKTSLSIEMSGRLSDRLGRSEDLSTVALPCKRYREMEKIQKSIPEPRWLVEAEDFFASHRQRPPWDDQVEMFRNDGKCLQYRSYFDRFVSRPSDKLEKVGRLRSTWLIGNPMDGEDGRAPEIHSPTRKILYSHQHMSPTPRFKHICHSSLQTWEKNIPDLCKGRSKYTPPEPPTVINPRRRRNRRSSPDLFLSMALPKKKKDKDQTATGNKVKGAGATI